MDKEENLVFRHLLDLAKLSFARDISVFSDFLNNREVAILKRQVADLPLGRFFLYGGLEDAERVMVCFPASYEDREDIKFPIECIEILIKSVKYENNSLTHRDFLGAILGLGIDRKLIGDIFTVSENGSIAFTTNKTDEVVVNNIFNQLNEKYNVIINNKVVKVSLVGIGLSTSITTLTKIFEVLSENNISFHQISSSEITISIIVSEEVGDKVASLLAKKFEL